jgi:tetratricopeptide (TPR) repeat protein
MSYEQAKNYYIQSLELSRFHKNQLLEIFAVESLGFLALFLGELDEAIQRFRDGVAIAKDIGRLQRGMNSLVHIGFTHWLGGDFEKAGKAFDQTLSISSQQPAMAQLYPLACYAEYLTMIGSYHQANDQLNIIGVISSDYYVDRFVAGRIERIKGFVALTQEKYSQAKSYFEKSVEIYQLSTDDEQIAWSQAGLARAMIGLGEWEKAKQLILESLWTSIEIKGFIPLVFTLPMTLIILSRENVDMAINISKNITCLPILAKAQFFEDVVYNYLPEEIISATQEGSKPDGDMVNWLMSTAAGVLNNWIQAWVEEPAVIEKEDPS